MTTTSTPSALRFGKRLDAGGAAIDGDQERRAARGERAHRLDIRAVAFEQPVGNVDERLDAAMAQKPRQQRRRGRAVDVVIAEDRDRLAAHDGVGKPLRRFLHAGEHVRIGHRAPDRRIEKGIDRVDLDIAAGKDARQQFGQVVALRDRQRPRGAALIEPVAPSAAGRGAFDAEEQAILWHGQISALSCSAQAEHPVNANALCTNAKAAAITGSPAFAGDDSASAPKTCQAAGVRP